MIRKERNTFKEKPNNVYVTNPYSIIAEISYQTNLFLFFFFFKSSLLPPKQNKIYILNSVCNAVSFTCNTI